MNYQYLRDKPTRFESLTGWTLEEFSSLLPYFTKHFLEYYATKTLDGKPRIKRRYSTYKSSCLPSFEDKLLFILVYLRKATTQDVRGELFGMSQPIANKWIHRLLSVLNLALAELGELPSRETIPATFDVPADTSADNQVSELFFHDGTERPIQRPKDAQVQKTYYSGKKKQHTIKNNLVSNAACKVVLLTPSFEGRIHDKQIADTTGYTVPSGSTLYQDSGFQGWTRPGVNVIQPKKKPRGGELTPEEKEKNRLISSIRIRVEHVISGVKRYRIVKDKLRNWKKGFSDLVMETCCGLHNFRLNFRPWCYNTPPIKSL